jgi:hypothetical protein
MTILSRLAAMLALMATLFVVVSMPSAANAHPLHAHGAVAAGSSVHATKPAGTALAAEELTAAPVIDATTADEADCDKHGCSSGHCHGHGSVLTPGSLIGFSASDSALMVARDISAPSGLAADGPARPPRTFA